jgi:hypothetical protein
LRIVASPSARHRDAEKQAALDLRVVNGFDVRSRAAAAVASAPSRPCADQGGASDEDAHSGPAARCSGTLDEDSPPPQRTPAGSREFVGRPAPRAVKPPAPSHLPEEPDSLDTGEMVVTGACVPERTVAAPFALGGGRAGGPAPVRRGTLRRDAASRRIRDNETAVRERTLFRWNYSNAVLVADPAWTNSIISEKSAYC